MGRSLSEFRDSFYRDLIREYRRRGETSLLYQYFWEENVAGLLEKYLPDFSGPVKPKHSARIRARLEDAVRERRDLLLVKAPRGNQKERRDFWEELWLNDAGYQAGLITDTEYYLWLVEYLAVRDVYYRDKNLWDIRLWLVPLLRAGWQGAGEARDPGQRQLKNGTTAFSTAQIGQDLRELAEQVKTKREAVASRLHNLREGREDYLPQLTAQLERMALHMKIKNWLQDSGYPLLKDGEAMRSAGGARKQDFSLGLFEAYFSSGRGGHFLDPDGGAAVKGWTLNRSGFCVLETDQLEALQRALEQSETTYYYIPLAVDPLSGCVFFLAGKGIYETVYQEEEEKWKTVYARRREACRRAEENCRQADEHFADTKRLKEIRDAAEEACKTAEKACRRAKEARAAYDAAPARFCFDFLRLDQAHLRRFSGNAAGSLRLKPTFHKNAGKSYQTVLGDFKWYCARRDKRAPYGPLKAIQEFNLTRPDGIPEDFLWAFPD